MTPFRTWALVALLSLASAADGQAATKKKVKADLDATPATKVALVARTYSVTDLVVSADGAEDADMLIKFVQQAVRPTSWKGQGGSGMVVYKPQSQSLTILQTPSAHAQIGRLLKALVMLQGDAERRADRTPPPPPPPGLMGASGLMQAMCSTPPAPLPGPAPRATAKQYGHFVLDNVRVNAMGVTTTIKKVKIMYKGDGIEADVAKCALTNGESERKGDVEKILKQLTELVEEMKEKQEKKADLPPAPAVNSVPVPPGSTIPPGAAALIGAAMETLQKERQEEAGATHAPRPCPAPTPLPPCAPVTWSPVPEKDARDTGKARVESKGQEKPTKDCDPEGNPYDD